MGWPQGSSFARAEEPCGQFAWVGRQPIVDIAGFRGSRRVLDPEEAKLALSLPWVNLDQGYSWSLSDHAGGFRVYLKGPDGAIHALSPSEQTTLLAQRYASQLRPFDSFGSSVGSAEVRGLSTYSYRFTHSPGMNDIADRRLARNIPFARSDAGTNLGFRLGNYRTESHQLPDVAFFNQANQKLGSNGMWFQRHHGGNVDDYGQLISEEKKLVVGYGGQFFHDITEHAPYYLLLPREFFDRIREAHRLATHVETNAPKAIRDLMGTRIELMSSQEFLSTEAVTENMREVVAAALRSNLRGNQLRSALADGFEGILNLGFDLGPSKEKWLERAVRRSETYLKVMDVRSVTRAYQLRMLRNYLSEVWDRIPRLDPTDRRRMAEEAADRFMRLNDPDFWSKTFTP